MIIYIFNTNPLDLISLSLVISRFRIFFDFGRIVNEKVMLYRKTMHEAFPKLRITHHIEI